MSREMYLIDAAKNDVVNLHWITGSEWGTVKKDERMLLLRIYILNWDQYCLDVSKKHETRVHLRSHQQFTHKHSK